MEKGIIIKSTGSFYSVKNNDGILYNCTIRGKLRLDGIRSTNPVAVGDIVKFEIDDNEKKIGVITDLYERKNYIIRKSTNLSKRSQIIAANIDNAYLFVTIKMPETATEFIDRFLLTAEAYKIPVTILFNKIDLLCDEEMKYLNYLVDLYQEIGYECIGISALHKTNIDVLKSKMSGKINLLAGNSGVGKSTLINIMCPQAEQKTGVVSDAHLTGKHTTTFAEMIEFEKEGYIIDTPGIKGFGLVDINKEELFHFFPEIFKVSKNCFYYNCTHIHEPNCAVLKAIENDEIAESRYNSYFNIYHSGEDKHRN